MQFRSTFPRETATDQPVGHSAMKGSRPPPKAKGSTKSIKKPSIQRLVCDFQTSGGHGPEAQDSCLVCGFSTKRPLKNLKGTFVAHACVGPICLKCLQRTLNAQFACGLLTPFCPLCLVEFSQAQLGQLYPDLSNRISEKTLPVIDGLVECPFCLFQFVFQPGDPAKVAPEYGGRALTPAQRECSADNYLRCIECEIPSCFKCHAVPYHHGETCQEHRWFVAGYVCRICGRAADPETAPNGEIALLTCGHPDCVRVTEGMCDHVHPCGHACVGIRGEEKHPQCPECSIGGSTCLACDKELWGSICLTLNCGHTIHKTCAVSIIQRRRVTGVLELPLCPAPGCGEFVKHDILALEAPADYRAWTGRIETMANKAAQQRIFAEGIEYHPEVCSKSSPFSRVGERAGGKAALYWAKKRLRFMFCDTTSHPPLVYTAGRADDPLPDDFALLCPACQQYPFPVCQKRHKHKYMQFKCETCCSIGTRLVRSRVSNAPAYAVWNCEICCDMPGRAEAASREGCKGNCMFAPHQKTYSWGKCAKCHDPPVSKVRRVGIAAGK
jgi:hypothetical protein